MEEAFSLVCSSSHVNQGQCVLWQNWSVWWRVANLECPSPRLPPAWNGKNCTASLSKKEVRGSSAFKPVISLGLFSCWTIRHEGWMQSLLYSYGPFFIWPHFQNCVSSLEGRGGSNRMQPHSHRREHTSYICSHTWEFHHPYPSAGKVVRIVFSASLFTDWRKMHRHAQRDQSWSTGKWILNYGVHLYKSRDS